MKRIAIAFIVTVLVLFGVVSPFAYAEVMTSEELWTQYIEMVVDSYLFDETIDDYLVYYSAAVEHLEKLLAIAPNDWGVLHDLAEAEEMLAVYESVYSDDAEVQARCDSLTEQAMVHKDQANMLIKDITLDQICNNGENAQITAYRYYKFAALNMDERSQALEALEQACTLADHEDFKCFLLGEGMRIWFPADRSEQILINCQVFGVDSNHSELYKDKNALLYCNTVIDTMNKYLQMNTCRSFKHMAEARIIEANAFKAYTAYFENNIEELLICCQKAEADYLELSVESQPLSALYLAHIYMLLGDLAEDTAFLSAVLDIFPSAYETCEKLVPFIIFDAFVFEPILLNASNYFDYVNSQNISSNNCSDMGMERLEFWGKHVKLDHVVQQVINNYF